MRSGVSFSTIDFTRWRNVLFPVGDVPPVDALSLCGGMAACASEAALSGPAPETCDRPRDRNTRINPQVTSAPTIAPLPLPRTPAGFRQKAHTQPIEREP